MTVDSQAAINNPFLSGSHFPEFDKFHVEHIRPAMEFLLANSKNKVEQLVADESRPTWQNFIEPLEEIDNLFEKVWGPIGHLDATMNSDSWHEAYNDCLQQVTQYHTEMGQNAGLYKKFKALYESGEFNQYSIAQKKVIENALRNFELSGIGLPAEQQAEFKQLRANLSNNSSQFANNVLKSTQSWFKHIEDDKILSGIPESSMGLLQQLAEQRELDGWCVTLDFPSYLAVMTHADNRSLREEVYKAFSTRASNMALDISFDNSELIERIRADRHKISALLNFSNYAEYSLATKMAESTEQVLQFLKDLAAKSKPQAEQELDNLQKFAADNLDLHDLEPWDITYASEKLKNASLSLSQETLRPFFPVERVLDGLFSITKTLFDIQIKQTDSVAVWHKDVRFFELKDRHGGVIGHFYLDLYARENKRGGAWMDSAITRWKHPQGQLQTPVAYLVCNFTPPVGDKPACLTHDEVTTLFHEFGHGIHHLFTKMEQLDVSGISGVPWDAVELPSQFMENFCWEREGLDLISSHIETGESLTDDLFEALKKGRKFQSAMMMLRQIEFALIDFEMHTFYDPNTPEDILELANRIRNQVAVIKPPAYGRMLHSFSHIFAGGYAAGYYSYKWAEVLSADAFSLFEETGVLNADTGAKFRNTILAAGGSIDPMELFKQFRGREPQIDALLRHSGIAA
ncbi:M3 family metallopeptidase [Thiomicrorhabdus sediminis]|uniref:oligopeptidase A n=1 Tax=Thiomicrorhabdus sediminis TaxID=2580412 RepID=A0A4P9K4N5_9GAMM|nr:M3 family metallopeptidase [Thiomicrorhabdus sediminis]QCU89167.1 M3 family metallopeptidase [Thiomicrorhabdus sediminis]